ncbi:MAG: group 1 truncated hemoglobin [Bacteroidota bacterium]
MKSNKLTFIAITAFLGMSSLVTSCKKDDAKTPSTPAVMTLYDTLGGTTMVADPSNPGKMIEKGRLAIRGVVDSSIFVIAGDPKMQPYFTKLLAEVGAGNLTGFATLSDNFTTFVATATGAKNYTYTGMNMKDAHDPAKNSRMAQKADAADFDLFVGDIVVGAKKNGVPDNIIARLGTILNSVKADVVQK